MELVLGLLLTGLPDWLEHAQRVIYRMRFFHTTQAPWPCFIGSACATGPSESRVPSGHPPVQLSLSRDWGTPSPCLPSMSGNRKF